MNYKEFFKGKKITCMGLGLIGKGAINPAFLADCGAEIIATDLKTEEELKPTIEKLKHYKNIKFVLGGHRLEDFENRDFILKNQGVPLDSPFVLHAKEKGIPIEMDEALFMKLAPEVKIIGITGTRGKSTTTYLIYEIIKASGKRVFLGGNLPGTSVLPFLKEVKEGDIVVLELSSWQLQGFGESKISPHISVFTNFMPDHLNYYKNDLKAYFKDKENIYKYQTENDFLIIGPQLSELKAKSRKLKVLSENVPKDWKVKIPGGHNLENIACAIKVAEVLEIKEDVVKKAVENFSGVSGRLQKIKEINGVEIWNDNNATTPEATIAALKAMAPKPVILIMGGAEKGLDMSALADQIYFSTKKTIFLKGTGTDNFIKKFNLKGKDVEESDSLEEAVELALASGTVGDVILFSPAFASFGMFKNEYDRNDQFVEIINNL